MQMESHPTKVFGLHHFCQRPTDGPKENRGRNQFSLTNHSEVLGMKTFSLRFIPNMATMTAPLRHLLQKGSKFEWMTTSSN